MLGERADQRLIERCCNSVIAQCVFYCHCKPLLLRMEPGLAFDHASIEALVDHVTEFSLMAINGMAAALSESSPAVAVRP